MSGNLAYRDDCQEKMREELIGGEVFLMAPASTNHVLVSGNVYSIFGNYLKGKKCVPFMDGVKVFLTEQDHFVPDMMVVCDREKIKPDGVHGAPDLVAEILSPSTMRNDKTRKKEVYAKCGVLEYWIVSSKECGVQIYYLYPNDGKDGKYELVNSYILENDKTNEHYNTETVISLRAFPHIHMTLADIFEDVAIEFE